MPHEGPRLSTTLVSKPDGSYIAKANEKMGEMAIWTADRVEAPARMERSNEYCRGQVYG